MLTLQLANALSGAPLSLKSAVQLVQLAAGLLANSCLYVTVCCSNIALCSNCWIDIEKTRNLKVTAITSCYLLTKTLWTLLVVGTQNSIEWLTGGAYHNVPKGNCVQRPDLACHQTHTYMSAVIAQAVALGIFFYWHIILLKFGVKDAQQMPYRSFRCGATSHSFCIGHQCQRRFCLQSNARGRQQSASVHVCIVAQSSRHQQACAMVCTSGLCKA